MLSILCSTVWGHVGFNVGVFIGGMMMQTKHQYKREDAKKDKLEKWYLKYLKNTKYPSLDEAYNEAKKALDEEIKTIETAADLNDLSAKSAALDTKLIQRLITDKSFVYFKDPAFKNSTINVSSNADLATTRGAYYKVFDKEVGKLGVKGANYYHDQDTTGAFQKARTAINNDLTAKQAELGGLAAGNPGAFYDKLKDVLQGTAVLQAFDAAIRENPQVPRNIQTAAKNAFDAWVDAKMMSEFKSDIQRVIADVALRQDDPLEKALAAYQADEAKTPSADEYNPEGTKTPPLTSPEVCDGPGEQDNWETLAGENQSKRIGLAYGFSVGYEKEMDANHTFVGGNAFTKKDNMTIKYDLQVEKGSRASFGELETKPGYTFGVTVVAGKHLNPVFSVFGRGTFEFTKYNFSYAASNDSPKIAKESLRTQNLDSWIKQAAVGVGARYNFAPLWSAEACYDFIPATKTTVRDFNKLGEDDRRRGYVYTTSQHRVFLKVVRFFKV